MRVLLDTHALLWAAFRKELLSARAKKMIEAPSNEILVSAASAWEIATKYRLGKLPLAQMLVEDFVPRVAAAGYVLLSISAEHALRAGRLPADHKDPFDRMLVAQAKLERVTLLTHDRRLLAYGDFVELV